MPRIVFRTLRLGAVGCLTAILLACGGPKIKVSVSSSANVNMNARSEPLAVLVRIYLLADHRAFEAASFEDLWKNDRRVLGNSLLVIEELSLPPSSQERVVFDTHDQVKYLGAIAIFRDPVADQWRAVRPITKNFVTRRKSASVQVSVKGNSIEIQ